MKNTIYLIIISLIFCQAAFSEEVERELPKSGTLASSGAPSFNGPSDGPWGGIDLEGENTNPLLATIQKISDKEYSYTVKNNSEDSFSSSLRLVAYNLNGKRIKSTPASVSLRAGQSVTRTIRVGPGVNSLKVEMASFKQKSKKPQEGDLVKAIAEKKKELRDLQNQMSAAKKK